MYRKFGILLLAACAGAEEERAAEEVPVIAQEVRFLPEMSQVEAIGTARAASSAELFPETAGRVTRVMFSAGDYVRQGTSLLQLDDRAERLDVEAARVSVQEADQLLGRYRRIEDTGAISESQIEAAGADRAGRPHGTRPVLRPCRPDRGRCGRPRQ